MRSSSGTMIGRTVQAGTAGRRPPISAAAIAAGLVCLGLAVACSGGSPSAVSSTTSAIGTPATGGCGQPAPANVVNAPSPACSHPGPTESPWPVSETAAVATANAFLGRIDLVVTGQWHDPGRLYSLADADRWAIVDGETGRVIETFASAPVILPGPNGEAPTWTPLPSPTPGPSGLHGGADAIAIGAQFIVSHHLVAPERPSASPAAVSGAPAWLVTWSDDGVTVLFELRLDAATGLVTGFLDHRPGIALALPRLDRDAAVRLAIARANADQGRTDERVSSAELRVDFPGGRQATTWEIGLGVPRPDPSASEPVWWFGTVIDVDATSGALTVVK